MSGKESSSSEEAEMYRKWRELQESDEVRKKRQAVNSLEAIIDRWSLRPPTDRLDLLLRPDMSESSARVVLEAANRIDVDNVTFEYPLNKMGDIPLGQLYDAVTTVTLGIVDKHGNPAVKVDKNEDELKLSLASDPDNPSIIDSVNLLYHWDADAFPMISGVRATANIDLTRRENDNLGYHFFSERMSKERPQMYVGPLREFRLTEVMYKTLLVGRQWMFNVMLEWNNANAEFPKPVYPPNLSKFLMSFQPSF